MEIFGAKSPETLGEGLKQSIEGTQAILLDAYKRNSEKKFTYDDGVKEAERIWAEIGALLKSKGIQYGTTNQDIVNFLSKNKIVIGISLIPAGNNMFQLNNTLYKVKPKGSYDLSSIQFDPKYGLPRMRVGVPINEVESILVPDIRERQGFFLDGLTVQNPHTNESTVLIFPQRIEKNAKDQKINPEDYKKSVLVNEVSQVYFSKIVPNNLLSRRLNEAKIPAPEWATFGHFQEAFSDLSTFKYSKAGKAEMMRIFEAKDDGYRLSKLILIENSKLYFPTFREDQIKAKIAGLSDEEFRKYKQYITEGYEQNLLPTLALLRDVLKK